MCSSSSVVLAAARWFLGGLLSSQAPFVFCSLCSGSESREFSSERVMVWRLRAAECSRRRAGLSFVVRTVKAQQGEPPG